jgi:hypothetical protein
LIGWPIENYYDDNGDLYSVNDSYGGREREMFSFLDCDYDYDYDCDYDLHYGHFYFYWHLICDFCGEIYQVKKD